MTKTEKEYYSRCLERTRFGMDVRNESWRKYTYPTCVYFDTVNQRCELNYCYRMKGEKK